MDKDLFRVGVILRTHGLKGEVKVFPTTDDPMRFTEIKEAILDTKNGLVDVEIEKARFFKNQVILKFKGIDDINDVEKYIKNEIYVTRENATPLEEDEYYISDLEGLKVVNEAEEYIGILKEVLQTGANDVYIIEREGKEDLLLPAIKDCILNVDMEAGTMKVHVLKGLE